MEETSKVYRIRTKVGDDAPNVIHVPMNQTYDMFEILSLKLNQTNTYKSYESDYGILVGRVTANGGFGVPNAKVSIFIPVEDDEDLKNRMLYNFSSTSSTDFSGVRYNLLPDFVDDACHQNVGTFPNKRLVLDNKDVLEMFDKYWTYTTVTNQAGDYMIFGVPTGSQKVHVDVDLSDCGILSQRPRDMISKGYNATMFESPNKFKSSTNLNSLPQIVTQDKGVYIYPYWGDVSEGDDKFAITRCDVNLEYKFEPYAVFMGSIITDKASNAIRKNCAGTERNGKMSDLISGEGDIEMIRKTIDGKVEEFPIMGNRLIDSNGVWCYSIPMNLDYITTDEFGNIVPTDNPDNGIPTRARVRFRFTLDDSVDDATARKRAKYLVPNNPRMSDEGFAETLEPDFEFGSATREESYCDLFWNKVYTVKNYIPKLQKNTKETNRKHTGIKLINHHDDNNPMPYNALTIKLSFTYRLICVITKIIINLVEFLNELLTMIGALFCLINGIIELPAKLFKEMLCIKFKVWKFKVNLCPFTWIGDIYLAAVRPIQYIIDLITPSCIALSSNFCDDGVNRKTYYPGCGYAIFKLFKMPEFLGIDFGCSWQKTQDHHIENEKKEYGDEWSLNATDADNNTAMLYNCVENELAQANDATSFNFYNDWVNGVLYAPLWFRKITPKKSFFFGLFKKKTKDDWCSAEREFGGMRIIQHCVTPRRNTEGYTNFDGKPVLFRNVNTDECGDGCHEKYAQIKGMNGVIQPKQNMLDQTVYYYKPVEYDTSLHTNGFGSRGEVKLLFATDIVLLGSLSDCDMNGIPQFYKSLESSTYNMPSDILFSDYDFVMTINDSGDESGEVGTGRQKPDVEVDVTSEMAGCDWGNPNEFDKYDGGLFYSIGCSTIEMVPKSCVNLSRICEYGVSLDETKYVADLNALEGNNDAFTRLVTDGYVSYDELFNLDERSMFATMNGNKLKTKLNEKNGLREYEFRYLYPENFDGSLRKLMEDRTKKYSADVNYKLNYNLETASKDYYKFRMGNNPYFYDGDIASFPRYENSFYFYFGLKAGKTAIEKFNSLFFAECNNPDDISSSIGVKTESNSWCSIISGENDGYVAFDFSNISTPYDLLINSMTDASFSFEIKQYTDEKIYISNNKVQKLEEGGYKRVESVNMFDNGSYLCNLTDANGEISEFTFSIETRYLSYKTNIKPFKQPNNVLLNTLKSYDKIASDGDIDVSDITNIDRKIGGVITIYDLFNGSDVLENFRIEVRPKEGTKLASEYDGDAIIFQGGTMVSKTIGVISWDNENNDSKVIAFGLPFGGSSYTVTVTELCKNDEGEWVDSGNSVTREFIVSEPMKYKMFINDIDYDVIKYFSDYTGFENYFNWNIGKTDANITENEWKDINVKNNPWFNPEHIFTKVNENLFKDISELEVDWLDDEHYRIIDQDRNVIDFDKIWNEFSRTYNEMNAEDSDFFYNWCDDYIVDSYTYDDAKSISYIEDYISKVNVVLGLRKALPNMIKSSFYMTCDSNGMNINIRVQTSDKPSNTTINQDLEYAVEDSDYNTLKNNDITSIISTTIRDIRIPTITYAGSPYFGEWNNDANSKPCCVKINGSVKAPYSVGTMNNSKESIPVGLKSETYSEGGGYKIENNELVKNLFHFPIIDKIVNTDYVMWSAFVNLPKFYAKGETAHPGLVNMFGLLAGFIYNGYTNDDGKFNTQSLNDLALELSINLSPSTTYAEKRIFNGYESTSIVSKIKSILSKFGFKLPSDIDLDNINVSEINKQLGFTFPNYKVIEGVDSPQYSFILPMETTLQIKGNNSCGITDRIYGDMSVNLNEDSVNDCKTNKKVFKIDADDDTTYYPISVSDMEYPLNHATNNIQIKETIDGIATKGKSYNLFSYKMLTSDILNLSNLSGIVYKEPSEDDEENDSGIEFKGDLTKPFYVIVEIDGTRQRALSPVYDYSDISGIMKFGEFLRPEIVSEESEDGSTTFKKEDISDYRLGIALTKYGYYFEHYPYRLSGEFKLNSVTTLIFNEATLYKPGDFVFMGINESVYNTLNSAFTSSFGSSLLNQYKNGVTLTAYDYVDLRHICGISDIYKNTWYTWIWNLNIPDGYESNDNTAYIEIGVDGKFGYVEDIYEKNDTPTIYTEDNGKVIVNSMFKQTYNFLGWSENVEDATALVTSFPTSVTETKVYVGVWGKMATVIFYASDGITELARIDNLQVGDFVSPPSPYDSDIFRRSDETNAYDFATRPIESDLTKFIMMDKFTVRWLDNE